MVSPRPKGAYYYACTYCDMECGRHERHDEDCLYQMAKNTVEAWDLVEKETKWDTNYKNEPRDLEEIEDFREWAKYNTVFEKLS